MNDGVRAGEADAEHRLTELQMWAVSAGASCWIVDVIPYESSRVAGLVERLTIDPLEGVLDALITDGTGRLVARWTIARPALQLAVVPGRGVLLEGVTFPGHPVVMMIEPTFELLPICSIA